MRTVVAYTSKTGFTQTYAEWLADELQAELVKTEQLTPDRIARADVIVHGGGLRASRVGGLRRFLRHWPLLATKHVILWHTGANTGDPVAAESIWRKHLSQEQLDKTTRFYLRGGFDYDRLRGRDRIVMRLMRAVLERKKNPSADDTGLLEMYRHPRTELDRAAIEPLVSHVRGIGQ